MKHDYNRVSGTKKRTEDKDSPLTYSQMPKILNIEEKLEVKLAFIEYQGP